MKNKKKLVEILGDMCEKNISFSFYFGIVPICKENL